MACYDASGVRSIVLYENIGVNFTYNTESGAVTEITNAGTVINIDGPLRPDYSNNVTPGSNYKLMSLHTVKWFNFDLTSGRDLLDQLRNIFGWYAVLTFNSGNEYLISAPLFYKDNASITSSGTHTWEINLQNEVDTEIRLISYEPIVPPDTNILYGYLYNWYALNHVNFAPSGWKVPTNTDYDDLITYLGGSSVACGKMKETGLEYWNTPNTGADNSSGFSGRGAGWRDIDGSFYSFKIENALATNTNPSNPYTYWLSNNLASIYNTLYPEQAGFTVRLIFEGGGIPPTYILDYDGNVYDVQAIGSQYWIKQNWACSKLNDGTALDNITDSPTWSGATAGNYYYCAYNNDDSLVFLP